MVVTGDHREAVEAQYIAPQNAPGGHRIVSAVGVKARLEPGPCIHKFAIGIGAGDLAHHRGGGMQRDLVLGHSLVNGLHTRPTTDVGDARTLGDEGDFLAGFDQAHTHGVDTDVQQLCLGQSGGQFPVVFDTHVVELHADPPAHRDQFFDRGKIVVTLPVGIHELTPETLSPRLSAVDVGADGGRTVLGHHQAVTAPESTVNKSREVVDVVDRREQDGIDVLARHVVTQTIEACRHLLFRKGR